MITLTVNNQPYEVIWVTTPPVWSRNRNETESDYGKVVVKADEEIDWRIYSPADMDGEQFVVQGYTLVKKGVDHYEYDVTLTENIDYFTQIVPESRIFSSWLENNELRTYTIGSILQIYKQTIGYYKRISIDFDSANPEYDTVVNADVMDGENLKEILNKLFDRIDSIPRVMRDGDTWFIYYEKFAEKKQPINLDNGYSLQREIENSEYATSMYVQAKNAIYRKGIYYPSSTGYVHARSENRIYKQSEAKISMPSRIADIEEFLVLNVAVQVLNSETEEYDVQNVDIDIKKQLVPKKEFDTIDQVGSTEQYSGKYQANTLYYTIGGHDIEHMYVVDGGILSFWSQDVNVLHNAMMTAWREQAPFEPGENDGPFGSEADPSTWRFRIKYTPQRDVTMDIERQNVNNMTPSQMPSQQNAGQIDLDRFAKNQMGAVNRIANPMRKTTFFTEVGGRLPQLGDYDGNWVVVYVRHTVNVTFTKTEVLATKNFNNLRAHYAINRDLSPFTISQQEILTNTVSKTYVELSKTNKQNDDIYLTTKGRQALLTFGNGDFNEEGYIDNGAVFDSNETGTNLYAENTVITEDGHISMNVQYNSPTLAGYKLDEDQAFWSNKKTLIPVRYTDTEGRMQYFDLKIGYELVLQDDYNFPEITDTIEPIVNITNAPSFLDSNGVFGHTHHLSIVTDDADDIVVVRNFAILNQLVTGELIDYRVYKSNVPFSIFDTKVRSSDISTLASIEWDTDNYALRLTSSMSEHHWALADTNGNILLAFNNYEGIEWIYFNFRNERDNHTLDRETYYYDIRHDLNIAVNATYTTLKLRKIDVAVPTQELGIAVSVDYLARKLNSVSVAANQDMGITTTATYTTLKPKNITVSASNNVGIETTVGYTTLKPKNINVSATQGIGVTVNVSYTPYVFDWVEGGTQTEADSTPGVCNVSDDLGNVKYYDTIQCTFESGTQYTVTSSTDPSTTQPECSEGATYTQCIQTGTNTWECIDYTGNEETVRIYETCTRVQK